MATPINPPLGVKHSESPELAELVGSELLLAVRPKPNEPGQFENVNVPAGILSPATNDVVGGFKSVIFLTEADAEAAGRPTDLSLDQILPKFITGGNSAYVDLPGAGKGNYYIAHYDGSPTPAFRSFIDGRGVLDFNRSPQDGLVPLHWVPVDSAAAAVPAYDSLPAGYAFKVDELIRDYVPDATTEQFFKARFAGPLPAPTAADGDSNWEAVNEAEVPPAPTALSQAYDLGYARYVASRYPDAVVAGRMYPITGAWNGGDAAQVVSVEGVQGGFATTGELLTNGVLSAVRVNVAAGTFELANGTAGGAPQWVAGKQTGGAFVYDLGVVYRVKQDIGSSQSAPAGNPANYERVSGDAALLAQHTTQIASNTQQIAANSQAIVTLGPLTKPFYVTDSAGRVGYDTLAAALVGARGGKTLTSNIGTASLSGTNITSPAAWYGEGNRVELADGAILRITGIANVYGLSVTANTGVVQVAGSPDDPASQLIRFIDCQFACTLRANQPSGIALCGSTVVNYVDASVTNKTTVYLYDSARIVDGSSQYVTVVDRRPGATGGGTTIQTTTYTAPAAGAQTIAQAGATWFGSVGIRTAGGEVTSLDYGTGYTFSAGSLQVLAAAGVAQGDVINYSYATGAVSGGGGTGTVKSVNNILPDGAGNVTVPTGGGAGGIDYENPVTITAAATLEVNKAHYVRGGGYTLTLPNAAQNVGKVIFIEIAPDATGLYPLAGASTTARYAGETLNLRATLSGTWKSTGGDPIPISARLETRLDQQDTVRVFDYYYIPLSVAVQSVPALPGVTDTANNAIVVPRNGRATVNGVIALKNADAGAAYILGIRLVSAGGVETFPVQLRGPYANGSAQIAFSTTAYFTAGDRLQLYTYLLGSTANLTGQFNGSQCSLTYNEI